MIVDDCVVEFWVPVVWTGKEPCMSKLTCLHLKLFPSSEHLSFVKEGVSLSLRLGQKCMAIHSTRITDFSSLCALTREYL